MKEKAFGKLDFLIFDLKAGFPDFIGKRFKLKSPKFARISTQCKFNFDMNFGQGLEIRENFDEIPQVSKKVIFYVNMKGQAFPEILIFL